MLKIFDLEIHTHYLFLGSFTAIMFALAKCIQEMINVSEQLNQMIEKHKKTNKHSSLYIVIVQV